jgi:hypothetical protein|tara:strand:+ start:1326 stop:1553 length:228 start_codon:yes stop_codon:yes gene_type:complete
VKIVWSNAPISLQLHLTSYLWQQSRVQLRDDAMTRRALRGSKAQIDDFSRRRLMTIVIRVVFSEKLKRANNSARR